MIGWHDPTWSKIEIGFGVGIAGLVGLRLLYGIFRRDYRRKHHYDAEKYMARLVESEIDTWPAQQPASQLYAGSRNAMRLWRVVSFPTMVLLALLCTLGGFAYWLHGYRILS